MPVPAAEPPVRTAFFGELHIHSGYSYDSYFQKVRSKPEDAYRYGRGEAVAHIGGGTVRPRAALDFMALTDHSEFLGFMPLFRNPGHPLSKTEFARRITSEDAEVELQAFLSLTGTDPTAFPEFAGTLQEDTLRSVWREYVALANRFYEPGVFTTLLGYEWTPLPQRQNLHRNVIFRGTDVPDVPFSSVDSINPEDLWAWMDLVRSEGDDVLAIPHNSNLSNGLMFPLMKWDGSPLDAAWAEQRLRNEPAVELTQIKGTSETHPRLSPADEWAGFEILDTLIGEHDKRGEIVGSYVRDAYLSGIRLQSEAGFNPYRFGLVGASDGHNSTSPVDEDNYTGKMGNMDGTAEQRRGGNPIHPVNASYSASGLAGVWAEENTRESIFDALRRRESFATSGTRISVRFFAGWELPEHLFEHRDWLALAYGGGVPMGGDLPSERDSSSAPLFAVWALKDPASAWLERAQIVKGWVENGKRHERVFDVACSDGLSPDPVSHRCPDNGAIVDLSTCDFSKSSGDTEFATVWRDPEFSPEQHAFYYARVLENPTCRWSTWEANRFGWELLDEVPPTLQERAWSSPIWYTPEP